MFAYTTVSGGGFPVCFIRTAAPFALVYHRTFALAGSSATSPDSPETGGVGFCFGLTGFEPDTGLLL